MRLLFLLGVERRAREIGVLMASGYSPRDVRRILMTEGAALAVFGGVLGLALGAGYAALMLYGLRTWWVGSVGTTFLRLFISPLDLAIGFVVGVGAGLLTIFFAVRSLSSAQPSRLLAGGTLSTGLTASAWAKQ